jgi:peptide/nickel transport system permease protein
MDGMETNNENMPPVRPGKFRLLWEQIYHSKTALVGLIIVAIFLGFVAFGTLIFGYSPTKMNLPEALKPPSLSHIFGTDSMGRDVFTRILYGARISLLISICGIFSAVFFGVILGLISGYYGGLLDDILMRIADFLFAFPAYILALFLMVVLGFGITNVIFAICLVYIPIFARLMRSLTQFIKTEQFVEANITLGANDFRIMFVEILPNGVGPIIVQATIGIAYAVILEAALSFLGLGVQPPAPSLGIVLADGKEYLRMAPWIVGMSGGVISVMLLGFNLLGDGIRDFLDPKLANAIK